MLPALPLPPRRLPAPASPSPGPRGERAWARALRWLADRRRLREMDARLLRDIGLTPADVAHGIPFGRPAAPPPAQPAADRAARRAAPWSATEA